MSASASDAIPWPVGSTTASAAPRGCSPAPGRGRAAEQEVRQRRPGLPFRADLWRGRLDGLLRVPSGLGLRGFLHLILLAGALLLLLPARLRLGLGLGLCLGFGLGLGLDFLESWRHLPGSLVCRLVVEVNLTGRRVLDLPPGVRARGLRLRGRIPLGRPGLRVVVVPLPGRAGVARQPPWRRRLRHLRRRRRRRRRGGGLLAALPTGAPG